MILNRKNTLVLLAVLVVSGGIVLGTGAFSTVQAERTVTVETAGDSSALLGLEANTTYNGLNSTGGTSGALTLGINNVNEDAITTFDSAVNVTNRGSQTVYFSVSGTGNGLTFTNSTTGADLSDNANEIELSPSESVWISLEVDTLNASPASSNTVTFWANSTASP